jgi:hypothetical protein
MLTQIKNINVFGNIMLLMALEDFKRDSTMVRGYEKQEIISELESVVEEYGIIDSDKIDKYCSFHYNTLARNFGDGSLESALCNLGFDDYVYMKRNSYTEEYILESINTFISQYGYFSINEFNVNPKYPSRSPIESKFKSIDDALNKAGFDDSIRCGGKHRHETFKHIAGDEADVICKDYDQVCFESLVNSDEIEKNIIADLVIYKDSKPQAIVEVKATYTDLINRLSKQIANLSKLGIDIYILCTKQMFLTTSVIDEIEKQFDITVVLLSDIEIKFLDNGVFRSISVEDYTLEVK